MSFSSSTVFWLNIILISRFCSSPLRQSITLLQYRSKISACQHTHWYCQVFFFRPPAYVRSLISIPRGLEPSVALLLAFGIPMHIRNTNSCLARYFYLFLLFLTVLCKVTLSVLKGAWKYSLLTISIRVSVNCYHDSTLLTVLLYRKWFSQALARPFVKPLKKS